MLLLNIPFLLFLVMFSATEANKIHGELKGLFGSTFGRAAPPRDTPKSVDPDCLCGQLSTTRNDDKIINGQEVSPKYKYPWMVLLKRRGEFQCAAILISTRFILTASHCVIDKNATIVEAIFGIHDISKAKMSNPTDLTGESFAFTRKISKIKIHGSYFDIALLKLAEPITFNDKVRPICLPKYEMKHSLPPLDAIIAGWGRTAVLGTESNVLRETVLQAFSAETCQLSEYHSSVITNEVMCATAPGKGICNGDSGGPLFYKTSTAYTLLGISSFSFGCADDKYPSVFVRVSHFSKWIYTKTRGGKFCKNPDNGL